MLRFYRFAMFIVPTLLAWGWFAALMHVDRNHRYRWFWWVLLPLGAVFYVLDVLFNWIFGTLIWFEVPREFTYTARLKRKMQRRKFWGRMLNAPAYTDENGVFYDIPAQARAVMRETEGVEWQASILNGIDPGHV